MDETRFSFFFVTFDIQYHAFKDYPQLTRPAIFNCVMIEKVIQSTIKMFCKHLKRFLWKYCESCWSVVLFVQMVEDVLPLCFSLEPTVEQHAIYVWKSFIWKWTIKTYHSFDMERDEEKWKQETIWFFFAIFHEQISCRCVSRCNSIFVIQLTDKED